MFRPSAQAGITFVFALFTTKKTPSCYIHPDREFFHCFGCGAGGDVISFIMKYHNLDYVEAIKMLAERANMEMPEDDFRQRGSGNTAERRKKIYDMNRDAAKFFTTSSQSPKALSACATLCRLAAFRRRR